MNADHAAKPGEPPAADPASPTTPETTPETTATTSGSTPPASPTPDAPAAATATAIATRVELGDWARLGAEAAAIRSQVFIEEQGIPAALEWDEADAQALHAVARAADGRPLATGRLLVHAPGVARVGRMAVLASARGSGVGRAVLDALLQAARQRGDGQALLHAQQRAMGFYAAAGFQPCGQPFDEAGIAHQEMTRALP